MAASVSSNPPEACTRARSCRARCRWWSVPDAAALARYTRRVFANTFDAATSCWSAAIRWRRSWPKAGQPGPIRHVVFVVKENRTFDQVFGQRPGVKGDASLTTLGLGCAWSSSDGSRVLDRVDVSPNHQALADRFAISDNFFCDADQSNTGHRWVAGVYPNEWVEVNARSKIEARLFSTAPGRRYVSGSSAVVLPEDYNEAGALWEHLDRHERPFFNFGFGTEMPGSIEEQAFKETGIRMAVSFPLPKPLFDRTSRKYADLQHGHSRPVPDGHVRRGTARAVGERQGAVSAPRHPRAAERPPDEGTPGGRVPVHRVLHGGQRFALGRLVETLSRTPWWRTCSSSSRKTTRRAVGIPWRRTGRC